MPSPAVQTPIGSQLGCSLFGHTVGGGGFGFGFVRVHALARCCAGLRWLAARVVGFARNEDFAVSGSHWETSAGISDRANAILALCRNMGSLPHTPLLFCKDVIRRDLTAEAR